MITMLRQELRFVSILSVPIPNIVPLTSNYCNELFDRTNSNSLVGAQIPSWEMSTAMSNVSIRDLPSIRGEHIRQDLGNYLIRSGDVEHLGSAKYPATTSPRYPGKTVCCFPRGQEVQHVGLPPSRNLVLSQSGSSMPR